MGWTYSHTQVGTPTLELLQKDLGENLKIVASSIKLTEAYLAIKNLASGEVFGCVVLIHRANKDYHNFGTKWVTEDMGPYQHSCPAKILDVLTPTENKFALEWRAACRANLVYRQRNKGIDLTGKRISLYGRTYRVTGKNQFKKGSWSAVGEHNGVTYRITRGQISKLTVLEEKAEQAAY